MQGLRSTPSANGGNIPTKEFRILVRRLGLEIKVDQLEHLLILLDEDHYQDVSEAEFCKNWDKLVEMMVSESLKLGGVSRGQIVAVSPQLRPNP